jgi:hypothetical protein
MAGLVPAIHVFRSDLHRKNVDARHKAGHDGASGEECSNTHSDDDGVHSYELYCAFICHARALRVIPGRRASVEPGIHGATEDAVKWIPGSRLRRAPE